MALIRKVKPGELFKLPTGGYVKNNSDHAVSMVFLSEQEVKSPNSDENETQLEVKNEELQSNSK